MKKLSMIGIIGGGALLAAAPFSLHWSQNHVAVSLDTADARIGRPLTATSVAGVHRRVHRRAYRRTVYAGTAAGLGGYGYGRYYGGYSSPAYSTSYYAPSSYYAPYSYYAPSSYAPSYYAPYSYYRRPYFGFSAGWGF
jgi:hypothetical protein